MPWRRWSSVQQVVLPGLVEDLQQQALLGHAHQVGAVIGGLLGHLAVGRGGDALRDLVVGDAFFLGPFGERQVERRDSRRHSACSPATSHCSG